MTGEDILQCLVESMPDMQCSRDVRGGDDNGIGFSLAVHVGSETLMFFPIFTPIFFDFLLFVRL